MSNEIFTRIKEWFDKKNKESEETYSSNISEAERKASEATDQAEIEKQKAIAQVWREAMEMHRKRNEDLEKELAEIKQNSFDKAKSNIANIKPSLKEAEFDKEDKKGLGLVLSIGKTETNIPLPEPSDKEQ